jgi:hypothetical protein
MDIGTCSLLSQYFTLGTISITETQNGDFSSGSSRTIIIAAPSGTQFLANTGSLTVIGGRNINNESMTITSTSITIQYNCNATNKLDAMTISGVKIRSTSNGNFTINRTGGNALINGLTAGTSMSGNIAFNPIASNVYRTNPSISGLLDWNQASTWECNTVPPNDGTAKVVIRAYQNGSYNAGNTVYFSGLPLVNSLSIENNANFSAPGGNGAILTILGNLTIQSGGYLQQVNWSQSGINTIQIGGDFTNDGFMVSASGNGGNGLKIVMNGTSAQAISGSGSFRMIGNGPGTGSLIVENLADVELRSNFLSDNASGNAGNVLVNGTIRFLNETTKFYGIGNLQLNGKAILKAGTFNEHFAMSGDRIISNTSTIEYTNPTSSIALTNIPTMNLNNLIINNTLSGNTTVSNPLFVVGTLSMLGGKIINGSNIIQIGTSLSNKGGLIYESGVVVGKLKRWFSSTNNGNQSGLFPIGNTVDFKRRFVTIEYTQPSDGGTLTAEWLNEPMGTSVTNEPITTNCNGQFTINNTASGYWILSPSDGISNNEFKTYTITLFAEELYDFDNDCFITAVKRDNNQWIYSGIHVDNLGNALNPSIKRLNATGWSNWGFGGEGNPLPIELLSSNAFCENNQVVFNWITASEHNSATFLVEKSENCFEWIKVNEVQAAGLSNEQINYSITDQRIEGLHYYRLTQKDIDGKSTSYNPLFVECSDESPFKILVWPNPSENSLNLFINDAALIGISTISIKNILGLEVFNKKVVCEDGMNLFQLNDLNLPSGLYFIQVSNNKYFSEVVKHLVK